MSENITTVFEETATVISQKEYTDQQFVLTLKAPKSASKVKPGEFAFIDCGENHLLRRPLSYLRNNATEHTVEFMYKIIGSGLEALSKLKTGDQVNLMGPIGNGFNHNNPNKIPVMIGGGIGIPPVLFLAEYLKRSKNNHQPIAFFGSELPFPFHLSRSKIDVAGIDIETNATIDSMENLNIPCRLASLSNFEGCHKGYVTELADQWIQSIKEEDKEKIIIYACGPELMLEATSKLAQSHHVDCKLSLEEYMACAIGGCAGCTVKVHTPEGEAMKRVCVDGPVFDAKSIFPNESD